MYTISIMHCNNIDYITAGGNQQIIGGHQGLITLPVGSALAQQILAANKQRQNQQQQLNVVNAQQITNNQTPQIFTSTAPTPQQISQKPASIQLLTNQQGQIQIGHIAPNQQASNIQIGHQILSTGNTGNIQVRTSQTGPQVCMSLRYCRVESQGIHSGRSVLF